MNDIDKDIRLIKKALALLIAIGPMNSMSRAEHMDEILSTVYSLDREIHATFYGVKDDGTD